MKKYLTSVQHVDADKIFYAVDNMSEAEWWLVSAQKIENGPHPYYELFFQKLNPKWEEAIPEPVYTPKGDKTDASAWLSHGRTEAEVEEFMNDLIIPTLS